MSKVTCRHCGHVWRNRGEYLAQRNHPCDHPACSRPAPQEQEVAPHEPVRQVRIQTHYKEVQVESVYDEADNPYQVNVPKVIVIHVLKRGK